MSTACLPVAARGLHPLIRRAVCAGCDDVRNGLKAVANSLVRKGMAKGIQVRTARAPARGGSGFRG